MKKKNNDHFPQKIVRKEKPVIFDNITVMKYTADELIEKNGKPCSDVTFPIGNANPGNDILWSYFSRDSGIKIREQIWKIDSVNYVVIWFTERDRMWRPALFDFRDIWTDY
jgi:hypothetical protein